MVLSHYLAPFLYLSLPNDDGAYANSILARDQILSNHSTLEDNRVNSIQHVN